MNVLMMIVCLIDHLKKKNEISPLLVTPKEISFKSIIFFLLTKTLCIKVNGTFLRQNMWLANLIIGLTFRYLFKLYP